MNLELYYEQTLSKILHERNCGCRCMENAGKALATGELHKQVINLLTDFYTRSLIDADNEEHRKIFKILHGRFGQ